jgi:hypothetical protein
MLKHTHGFSCRESENKNHIKICNTAKQIWQKAESLEQFSHTITAEFAGNKKVKIVFEDDSVICEYIYPKKEPFIVFGVSPCTYIVPEKSVSRVREGYTLGTRDHRDQYRMLLPDGKTCADCVHIEKCVSMWGARETNTRCTFGDNKFRQK